MKQCIHRAEIYWKIGHHKLECDYLQIENLSLESAYEIQIKLVQELDPDIIITGISQVQWENHQLPVVLGSVRGKNVYLNSPLSSDSRKKRHYFHQKPLNDLIAQVLASSGIDYDLKLNSLAVSYDQFDSCDQASFYDLIKKHHLIAIWETAKAPSLVIYQDFPGAKEQELSLAKSGLESKSPVSVYAWSEDAREQIIYLDSTCWISGLGGIVVHPYLGRLRTIGLSAEIYRESGTHYRYQTRRIGTESRVNSLPPAIKPSLLATVTQRINDHGEYGIKTQSASGDSYSAVSRQILSSHRWNFPYQIDETVVEIHSADGKPLLSGTLIPGKLQPIHQYATVDTFLWQLNESSGWTFASSGQAIKIGPQKISWENLQGYLNHSVSGSLTETLSKTAQFMILDSTCLEQKNFLIRVKHGGMSSANHQFLTSPKLQLSVKSQTEITATKNILLQASTRFHLQAQGLQWRGNFQAKSPNLTIKAKSLNWKIGSSSLTIDEAGIRLVGKKIILKAQEIHQTALEIHQG